MDDEDEKEKEKVSLLVTELNETLTSIKEQVLEKARRKKS